MTRLITVDEAKARLNVDQDLSDDDIDLMIQEASAQVLE